MSLSYKHSLFVLQEVPDVPCFGIPELSCLLLFHFFVFHLAFFFIGMNAERLSSFRAARLII
nr:MAG TPA: hypothetical protein [Bacteriophage sp.]